MHLYVSLTYVPSSLATGFDMNLNTYYSALEYDASVKIKSSISLMGSTEQPHCGPEDGLLVKTAPFLEVLHKQFSCCTNLIDHKIKALSCSVWFIV